MKPRLSTLYSKVLPLLISILFHSILCQISNSEEADMDPFNTSSIQTQDGSSYSSSQEVRYPSKAALTCLLAIRRRILKTYQPYLENFPGKIALLDTAAHTNVGDSILWLGAKELMAHFGRTPTVLCAGQQWDPQQPYFLRCPEPEALLLRLGDPALLLWHPGGNFGDVWRPMQTYRNQYIWGLEKTILDRPWMAKWNVTLAQLPQSIHYSNATILEQDGDLYKRLSHLHFSVASRDPNGLTLGQEKLHIPVYACPDLAFMIGPAQAVTDSSVDILMLIRSDKEGTMTREKVNELAVKVLGPHSISFSIVDWPSGENEITNRPQEMYTELAELRWQLGLRMISAGRMLITNRLHATVIGALLGVPTFYYDSLAVAGYGKVGGTIHLARKSSEACTESALRSWHVIGESEAESAEAAMMRAAKYYRSRSRNQLHRSNNN